MRISTTDLQYLIVQPVYFLDTTISAIILLYCRELMLPVWLLYAAHLATSDSINRRLTVRTPVARTSNAFCVSGQPFPRVSGLLYYYLSATTVVLIVYICQKGCRGWRCARHSFYKTRCCALLLSTYERRCAGWHSRKAVFHKASATSDRYGDPHKRHTTTSYSYP